MNTVLYYPYLYPSEGWLKTAALCWDDVYTLGAMGAPPLPEKIDFLNDAFGKNGVSTGGKFIKQIDTASVADDKEIASSFAKWLDAGGVDNSKASLLLPPQLKKRDHKDKAPFAILRGKTPRAIEEVLRSRGLLTTEHESNDQDFISDIEPGKRHIKRAWDNDRIFLPRDIALCYLSLCAAKAASTYQADLFADKANFAEAAVFSPRVARGIITTSIIEGYLPENLDSLSSNQISELRQDLSSQRLQWQAEIQSLCDKFSKVTSEENLHTKIKEITEIGILRIEETKRAYKRARLTTITAAIGLTFLPGAISSLVSLLGIGIFAPASIVSGVATASANALLGFEKAQAELTASSWSYVLNVKKRIDSHT